MQSTYASNSAVVNQIISTLQSGKPVIASLLSPEFHPDGRDLNHTVLVFSATYDPESPAATAVLTVNMGWNSLQTYVFNAILFYECGYLTSAQHTMGAWTKMNNIWHSRECNSCGYEELGQHADSWDTIRRVCTLCGHRGTYIEIEPYCNEHGSIN